MHRPYAPNVRPFLFIWRLFAVHWEVPGDAKWAVVTATDLALCWGWWVLGTSGT